MTQASTEPIRVGVLLDPDPGRIGRWLADAAAFDAAGADSLWLDLGPEPEPEPPGSESEPESESELDVLALAAALAVMTFRARLVVAVSGGTVERRRTIHTVGRLSQNRLALIADGDCGDVEVYRRLPGEQGAFEGPQGERWLSVPVPQGRPAWRAALADGAQRGARGLIVPADARLVDLLRNPEDPGERQDLQIAQG